MVLFHVLVLALSQAASPTPAAPQANLQLLLDEWVADRGVPGACLAVSLADGRTVAVASGLSDQEREESMTVEHRLMSGSIGKTYFAALFMQLVGEGVVKPDDRLSQFLGEEEWFARLPNAADITLISLFRHQSGVSEHVRLPEFWKAVKEQPRKNWQPEELVAFILDREPLFAVGEGWSYADTNYILAGMALERATGESVYRLVHRRLLQPLGLKDTLPTTSYDLPGLAQGYHILGEAEWTEARPMLVDGRVSLNPQLEWCGGGYYCTTADLARWGRLLFAGGLVPAGPLKAATAEAVPARLHPGDRYGTGLIVATTPHGPGWGHSGWFPGYLSEMMYFPEHGFAVAMQVNTDDVRRVGPLRPLLFEVAGLLRDSTAGD